MRMVVTFILGVASLGPGVATPASLSAPVGEAKTSANDAKPGTEANLPRVDLYGDALPQGAVARLGTMRFRQFDLEAMGLSADGRVLVTKSCAGGKVSAW